HAVDHGLVLRSRLARDDVLDGLARRRVDAVRLAERRAGARHAARRWCGLALALLDVRARVVARRRRLVLRDARLDGGDLARTGLDVAHPVLAGVAVRARQQIVELGRAARLVGLLPQIVDAVDAGFALRRRAAALDA